jgi:hypothetical protein
MTDKELWRQMDMLADETPSLEREMKFMLLLKQAYDKNMKLIIACRYNPAMPGLAQQGYLDVDGKRMLVCYTSKQRAKSADYNMTWDIARARDIMNNMFNKQVIMGMTFNPNNENMVIILKDMLLPIMPGAKPKPEFYKE